MYIASLLLIFYPSTVDSRPWTKKITSFSLGRELADLGCFLLHRR